MTDEQFDEICRSALDYDPGRASSATWSRIRPTRWSWLPTVPEILACGCACGLVLLVIGFRVNRNSGVTADSNPVIKRAMAESSRGLQASAFPILDTTPWSEGSLSLGSVASHAVKSP